MPSIFIVVIFAFLLGQRADGQDDAPPQECLDAFTQIVEACGMGDPGVNICSGDCGDAYEDAIRVCGEVQMVDLVYVVACMKLSYS